MRDLPLQPEQPLMDKTEQDRSKHRVAARALEFVEDGMRLGLGSGSTAKIFVDLLAQKSLKLRCVPTSEATRAQAQALGLDVTTLDELPELDLTVDGADEFDPALNLIKGGGGALLREKIVATASARMVVIADESKRVPVLGAFPLPVEVNRFGLASTTRLVEAAARSAGCSGRAVLRLAADGAPFVTDGGHLILDCHLSRINDPAELARRLAAVPGVVEHGLFIGMAVAVVTDNGRDAEVIRRSPSPSSTKDKGP